MKRICGFLRERWRFCLALAAAAVALGALTAGINRLAMDEAGVYLSPTGPDDGVWTASAQQHGEWRALAPADDPTGNYSTGYWRLERPGQVFYLSRSLPAASDTQMLALGRNGCRLALFLDGRPLYADPGAVDPAIGALSFSQTADAPDYNAFIYVSLPPGEGERTLTLGLERIEAEQTDVFGPALFLYASEGQFFWSMAAGQTTLVPLGALAMLGAGLLVFFLFQVYRRQADPAVLALAGAALLWAVWHLLAALFDLLPYHPLHGVALSVTGEARYVCLLAYMLSQLRPYRKAVGILMAAYAAVVLARVAADLLKNDLSDALTDTSVVLSVIALLFCLAFAIRSRRSGGFCRCLTAWMAAAVAGLLGAAALSIPTQGRAYTYLLSVWTSIWRFHTFTALRELLLALMMPACAVWSLAAYMAASVRRDVEIASLSMQNRFAAQSAAQLRENVGQVRALRHDLRHHVEALRALNAAGERERVGEYLDTLAEAAAAGAPLMYARSFLVNAVLSAHLSPAAAKGIRVLCSANVPEEVGMADADLCSLLSNLLSNAVEGCEALGPGADRFIDLDLTVENGLMRISCVNSAVQEGPSEGPFPSTKGDTLAHGLGIPAMRRIAKKYGGALEARRDAGRFIVRALLHLTETSGGA